MKVKIDFVTNSSSTGFMLTVFSNELTAEEFVEELWKAGIESCMRGYEFSYSKENLIDSLNRYHKEFPVYNFPLPEKYKSFEIIFGDESGESSGIVFDYCLRKGYYNEKFEVKFHASYR